MASFWAGLILESGAPKKLIVGLRFPELRGYFHKDYFVLNIVLLVFSPSEHICSL